MYGLPNKTSLLAWITVAVLAVAVGCGDSDVENGDPGINGEPNSELNDDPGNNDEPGNNDDPDTNDDPHTNEDPGNNDDPDTNNDEPLGETSQVHGLLQQEDGDDANFEGTFVTAFEVDASGDIEVVSHEEAAVESDGSFTVLIDLELYSGGEIFIEAEQEDEGSSQGSVLVEASVDGNAEVDAAPITAETTFEVDTFLEARSSGHWDDDDCSTAEHRASVTIDIAAEAKASGDYQSEVEAFARASTSAMKASVEYLMEAEGKTQAELEAYFEAQSETRAELDSQLLAQATDSESTVEAYLEATADALSELALDIESKASNAQASAEAFVRASAEMSTEVRSEARAHIEKKREFFVSTAIDAKLEALQAGADAQSEVESAAVELRGELAAATDVSAQVEAWAQFKAEVRSELEGEFEQALTELEAEMESAFEAYASTMADVESSADAEVISSDCVDAFLSLWAEADAGIDALTEIGGLVDDESTLEILVSLMVHLEVAAGLAAEA